MNQEENQKLFACACGSEISVRSKARHQRTKKHLAFLNDDVARLPLSSAEYQRQRFAKYPHIRERHRSVCRQYYRENREHIRERHALNRERRRNMVLHKKG